MMSKVMAKGIELNKLLGKLNKLVPLHLAEPWDNVGVMVRPRKVETVSRLLLTNDLTEDVLGEAIDRKVDFIFTFHPNIFVPLKSVNCLNGWKENVVVSCIENSIVVWSPHTALDRMEAGVHDWIVSQFDYASKSPIEPALSEDGKSVLENAGAGRRVELVAPRSIQSIVESCKAHFRLPHLRLALATGHTQDTEIRSISVCSGSGVSVLRKTTADLFITGELSHHEVLDFNHKGTTVILTEHSNCERGYLSVFAGLLGKELGEDQLECIVSEKDRDPLTTV